jgi:hypothetical protein
MVKTFALFEVRAEILNIILNNSESRGLVIYIKLNVLHFILPRQTTSDTKVTPIFYKGHEWVGGLIFVSLNDVSQMRVTQRWMMHVKMTIIDDFVRMWNLKMWVKPHRTSYYPTSQPRYEPRIFSVRCRSSNFYTARFSANARIFTLSPRPWFCGVLETEEHQNLKRFTRYDIHQLLYNK